MREKKPALIGNFGYCDCGEQAYRKKHGEPICERCDSMEQGKRGHPERHHEEERRYDPVLYSLPAELMRRLGC